MVIHWVSCHRFPISNLNYELNDVISATFYVQILTQNAEKTKNSKATNPGELDSLWALDKGYWWILYILYKQKISSVNNFVQLQRKGVRPVVNFVHGS